MVVVLLSGPYICQPGSEGGGTRPDLAISGTTSKRESVRRCPFASWRGYAEDGNGLDSGGKYR